MLTPIDWHGEVRLPSFRINAEWSGTVPVHCAQARGSLFRRLLQPLCGDSLPRLARLHCEEIADSRNP